jgi:hypothetical protein
MGIELPYWNVVRETIEENTTVPFTNLICPKAETTFPVELVLAEIEMFVPVVRSEEGTTIS